jgi:hypothetical protein
MKENLKEFILLIIALVAVVATPIAILALVGYFSGNTNALPILYVSLPTSLVSLGVTVLFKNGWLRLISWLA